MPRLGVLLCWPVLVLLWAQAASSARAEGRRIVLIDVGEAVEHAARLALEPWQLEVVALPLASPGATAPSTHALARDTANAYQASAVVWISAHHAGYALWMYDRSAQDAVARPLTTSPPFDAPAAAAVALAIKTLLRHSDSAPEAERYGAAQPTPVPDVALPAAKPGAAQPDATRAAPRLIVRAPPGRPTQFALDTTAAVRLWLLRSGSVEFRAGLAACVWPRARWGGICLRAAMGPDLPVHNARLRGSLRPVGSALSGHARWDASRWLRVSGALGLAAEITALTGTAVLAARAVPHTLRVAPALLLEVQLDSAVTTWLHVGVRAGGYWLLRTLRYDVAGDPVLELSRVHAEAALVIGVHFPNLQ